MRSFPQWLALCSLALTGCSPQQPPPAPRAVPAPAAPALKPVLELKPVMEWIIDPAADVIWDAVKTVSTEAGTKDIAPQNDEQWNAVRNAAATLMESSNLLMIPGRARDDKAWANFAQGLTKTAGGALKAAQEKNKDALFNAGGEIYIVCKGCHVQFAKHLSSSLRPDRVVLALLQACPEGSRSCFDSASATLSTNGVEARRWSRMAEHERVLER
jgi:hypothetical protein